MTKRRYFPNLSKAGRAWLTAHGIDADRMYDNLRAEARVQRHPVLKEHIEGRGTGPISKPGVGPESHGRAGYWRGCRCDVCRTGYSEYRKAQRALLMTPAKRLARNAAERARYHAKKSRGDPGKSD